MAKIIGSAALVPGGDSGTDLTTKGDLHGYSDENTRIPVGTNNQVLTADSAQALGLKWAASQGITASSTDTFTNKTYTNLKMKLAVELTISSGSVAVTQMWHTIDTEGDASTDDLTNATGGATGELLYLESVNSTHDVTIKDSSGGAGAFRTNGDFTLSQTLDTFTCMNYAVADEWLEISRSTN